MTWLCAGLCGALLWPKGTDAEYAATVAAADALEAYHGPGDDRNMYRRVEVEVQVLSRDGDAASQSVRAWTYECLLETLDDPALSDAVPGGDWPQFMREKGLQDAAEDWSEKHHTAEANTNGDT